MFDPPSGLDDLASQSGAIDEDADGYRLMTAGSFEFRARRPRPKSIHAVSSAARSKMGTEARLDHLVLFARQYIREDDFERMLVEMMLSETTEATLGEVVKTLCTFDTARPTRQSLRSA